ncbi:MAG: hypothetical protein NT011_05810 [Kiritimatiellaeota bacterium]|nr:hypothetical protein [Kiritimatiellota bacterium]
MTIEIIIGIAGVVLAVLTYFAGVQRTKQQYEQDDVESRINRLVDAYHSDASKYRYYPLRRLINSGVLLLRSDKEIREACRRLELRNSRSPLEPHAEALSNVDLHVFFQAIKEYKLNPDDPDCVGLAKEKMT